MIVHRTKTRVFRTNRFEVGDRIEVYVNRHWHTASAVYRDLVDRRTIFLFDCPLAGDYRMNKCDTIEGGYFESDLRKELRNWDIASLEINSKKFAANNGDLIWILSSEEEFNLFKINYHVCDCWLRDSITLPTSEGEETPYFSYVLGPSFSLNGNESMFRPFFAKPSELKRVRPAFAIADN